LNETNEVADAGVRMTSTRELRSAQEDT